MDKEIPEVKKSKRSKTSLFRFATLRSPQLISKQRRELGFVENTNPTKSFFLKEITNVQDLKIARQKMAAVSSGFSPLNSVEEVKTLAGDLWSFSMWLGKNKNSLEDLTELTSEIQNVSSTTAAKINQIWDNVFYDILTQKNAHVRQACLQLLVTNHFLESYPKGRMNAKELKRIANSKVIVSSAFSRKLPLATTPATLQSAEVQSKALKTQETKNQKLLAGETVKELTEIKESLIDLEQKYISDRDAALSKEAATFNKKTTEILAKHQKSTAASLEKATAEMNADEVAISANLIEPFEFDFPKPLSRTYTSRKLPFAVKDFIDKNHLHDAPVQMAIAKLDGEIFKAQTVADQILSGQSKSVLINRVKLRTRASYVPTYTISSRLRSASSGYELEVFVSFNAPFANASFLDSNFTIYLEGNSTKTYIVNQADLVVIPSNQPNTIFALLKVISLSAKEVKISGGLKISVDGSFGLDNGTNYVFNSKKATIPRSITGVAEEKVEDVPTDAIVHYGINKIGIADYRRVEQELCCYIPGEVSHIENILAREYKEKATRQLVRSEDVYESTTEVEVENLNDTTSTTKHELTSEISHVLEKDREMNLGFSTGASGEYFGTTFSANANGDFSYAQSSSDSDSIARTYAEDVTKRALERVVQKNTIKRTSKILKEFEENNKHGYDNRSGDKHVTGIFRWIDKIYTNQLVNYGKRLVYEFMLPEPGRFYKDLIIIEAESNVDPDPTGGTTLVAPVHPKDLDTPINGSLDITRTNYSSLAAEYGVSVPVPPKPSESVQATFTKNIPYGDQGQQLTTNFQNPVIIPQDYECVRLDHDLTIDVHRTLFTDNHWKFEVNTTQSRTFQRPPDYGNGNIYRNFTLFPPNGLSGTINVSALCTRVRAYTIAVTATCNLKNSVFQTWQQDVYDAIMGAYTQALNAYNQALAAANNSGTVDQAAEEDSTLSTNPKYTKQFITNELKRLCIEMMLKPFDAPQGMDFYVNGPCDVPQLNLTPQLDSYSRQVKFFEQCFDWTILSQVFYPYFWAKKCDWKDLFQSQDSVDHVLQEFLQSGMGRVLVPVREGFEDAVVYFMETGEIWHGTGIVLDSDDELYLSIVDEVTHLDGEVEVSWETVVPTSLTLVQGKSAYLDAEGLPCCDNDTPDAQILPDTNVLELLDDKE